LAKIWFGLLESAQMFLIANLNEVFVFYQNEMKLFEVTQNWMMFHLAQIWIELLPFGQNWFSLLEFTQIFPIY